MAIVKVIKSSRYYKGFQVKYKRRHQGKTDYFARRRMIQQDKNKYNLPKYRMVVRITTTDIICQLVYSRVEGDYCVVSAYSHELPRYGVKVGLTNYPAAYCTGLLMARRLLKQLKLDEVHKGVEEVTGGVAPPTGFRAILDIGLRRSSTGARIFGCMKGAVDGGMNIPHSNKRFPGYDKETKKFDAEVHRKHIFGIHISDYMKMLKDDDEEGFNKHFSRYIKAGVTADEMEEMYEDAHDTIRENPEFVAKPKKEPKTKKRWNPKKLSKPERRQRAADAKVAFLQAKLEADLGDDDDESEEEET